MFQGVAFAATLPMSQPVEVNYLFENAETEFELNLVITGERRELIKQAIFEGSFLGYFLKSAVNPEEQTVYEQVEVRSAELSQIAEDMRTKVLIDEYQAQALPALPIINSDVSGNDSAIRFEDITPNYSKFKLKLQEIKTLFERGEFSAAYKSLGEVQTFVKELRRISFANQDASESIVLYDLIVETNFSDGILLTSETGSSNPVTFQQSRNSYSGKSLRHILNLCLLHQSCKTEPFLGYLLLIDEFAAGEALKLYPQFYQTILNPSESNLSALKSAVRLSLSKSSSFQKVQQDLSQLRDLKEGGIIQVAESLANKVALNWGDYTKQLVQIITEIV